MKYHLIYQSYAEEEIFEYQTDTEPPKIGDFVDLPLGQDKKLGRYRVMGVQYFPQEQEPTRYHIEVTPA